MATAEAFFAAERWPDGVSCPHCGADDVLTAASDKARPYRCRANGCRKRCQDGDRDGEPKLGCQTWALAAY